MNCAHRELGLCYTWTTFEKSLGKVCFENDLSIFELSLCLFTDQTLNQSVGDWLADLELSEYENTFVGNGYDDMDFVVCYVGLLGCTLGL